ncbi:uncharacterized protein LOC128224119 [Mya arenaria]|uniref:uncharacterized protein LOC128224119 n=1 Tax=Mya arenaria TaxID=6604 RepID=UPI0022E104D7|nr:uncharacterized protein LOC128224119 [Mya arenaria]
MAHLDNSNEEIMEKVDITRKGSSQDETLLESNSAIDVSIFGESKGLADVTLIVEDRRIPVTKAVLELASPVFLAMFQGDLQEKEKSEIPLPGKRLPAFVKFLKCIYPNIMEKVTVENVYEVVYLANEYQVDHLKTACEQVLLNEMIKWEDPSSPGSCSKVYQHLVIAETCQLDELQSRCISIASGVTKVDREAAAKIHPISKKVEMIVDKQAIRKLEINTSDLRKLLRVVGGDNLQAVKNYLTKKQNIQPQPVSTGMFGNVQQTSMSGFSRGFGQTTSVVTSPAVFDIDPSSLANNLQKLRLVYQYAPDSEDAKKEAIRNVRNDKLKKEWKTTSEKEFDLLPEKIKHDIRGREVMKY